MVNTVFDNEEPNSPFVSYYSPIMNISWNTLRKHNDYGIKPILLSLEPNNEWGPYLNGFNNKPYNLKNLDSKSYYAYSGQGHVAAKKIN